MARDTRQQSSTSYPLQFPMFLSGTATPATGKTVSITVSKNGGSAAAVSGSNSEVGSTGVYSLAGNATDRNTLGTSVYTATATGCDPCIVACDIIAQDPFAATVDANVTKVAGTTQTARDLGANLDVAVSTRSTYAGADTAGTTTLLSRIGSALTITLGAVNVNDKTGFSLSTAGIKAIWDQATSALTTAGSIGKYLLDSIATLLTDTSTIQTNQATIINRIGAFTGSGVNTILGFLKGLLSKTASTPSDVGGTFDASTDSTEAIRDRGDAAWGSSGSAPQVLVDTTVAVVTDQTHFELTAAIGGNNTYLNQTAVFYDASGSNAPSVRKISAFADTNNAITIDSAPDFTVVAGDGIKIFVTPPGTSAPTAPQVADAVWDELETDHQIAGSMGRKVREIRQAVGYGKEEITQSTGVRKIHDTDGSTVLVTLTPSSSANGDVLTETPS